MHLQRAVNSHTASLTPACRCGAAAPTAYLPVAAPPAPPPPARWKGLWPLSCT